MKLSFRINKNINHTFDYLTNMQKFVSVHPVISQIDATGTESYLVHETLRFLLIPFSFTYPVTIEKNITDKKVTIRATVFKLTTIEMKFTLKADNDFTTIDEEINFKSPLPLTFIMQRISKNNTFNSLKTLK